MTKTKPPSKAPSKTKAPSKAQVSKGAFSKAQVAQPTDEQQLAHMRRDSEDALRIDIATADTSMQPDFASWLCSDLHVLHHEVDDSLPQ